MHQKIDYVVVGSGLTGAIVANSLFKAGRSVKILERRDHPAGLCFDEFHESGLLYQVHGPHAFRTNSDELWEWLQSYSKFYPFKLSIQTLIDGNFYVWPPKESAIKHFCQGNTEPHFHGIPKNFEEASLKKMPKIIYEKFVKSYSEKQWGMEAHKLWLELSGRFNVKKDEDDDFLFGSRFQGLPIGGFTALVKKIIKDIPIHYGIDFKMDMVPNSCEKKLIFTGCIDELFDYKYGKLDYRGMRHETKFFKGKAERQNCPVYNFPSNTKPYIRSVDWDHWQEKLPTHNQDSLISYGYPVKPSNSEENAYPILTQSNRDRLAKYKLLAQKYPKIVLCGRLADFRYYDMNHALARGFEIAKQLLGDDYSGPNIVE